VKTVSELEAKDSLFDLLDYVADTQSPVQIVGLRHSAILVPEKEWRTIQEALFRTAMPGVGEAVKPS
jgi:PHD/YefM family antitoxin component YafN of YafNO toxin-antitoxin module